MEYVRLTGPPARIRGSDGRAGYPVSGIVESFELEVIDRLKLSKCLR